MAKGLGSGLGALFGDDSLEERSRVELLPIGRIEPRMDQPRSAFDEEKLAELSQSIREHGLIQPVAVRSMGDGYYQIIAGERRWRAARDAGLTEIPANIIEADEQKTAELALIENLQREDLTPMEEARGYEGLIRQYGLTQEQVADRIGKSRPVITNSLRLLRLPPEVQELVEERKLSLSHARALLELDDPELQKKAAARAVSEGLSVKATTALVKRLALEKTRPPREKKNPRLGPDGVDYVAEMEQELSRLLDRKVRIEGTARGGVIKLQFTGEEDLNGLYDAIRRWAR